jgi:ABC-type lipoprotein release transport system permease subunit
VVEASRQGILGLAFAYLNIPDKLRFSVQTLLWVFFIYLLLSGVAWLFPARKLSNP